MAVRRSKKKPVAKVAENRYQPTKAEMEADMSIDATPEEVLKAVVRDVEVRVVDPKR